MVEPQRTDPKGADFHWGSRPRWPGGRVPSNPNVLKVVHLVFPLGLDSTLDACRLSDIIATFVLQNRSMVHPSLTSGGGAVK